MTLPDSNAVVGRLKPLLTPSRSHGADAIARAIRYAIAESADVDVSEIIVRPTISNMS